MTPVGIRGSDQCLRQKTPCLRPCRPERIPGSLLTEQQGPQRRRVIIIRCEDQSPFLSWLQPQAGTDAIYSCYINQILKTYFFQCEFLSDSNVNQLCFNKIFNYKVNK